MPTCHSAVRCVAPGLVGLGRVGLVRIKPGIEQAVIQKKLRQQARNHGFTNAAFLAANEMNGAHGPSLLVIINTE